ncbi:GMC family oxidoreductase [Paenibacillus sp. N4]|uniref:GMC oxidoreductase n=1 Tax=Paenibacillus vietnamensis TaxID=2590547 RepID=UPI001CD07540|nr:GMC family oxidoreductase [Paenibacillus vietnamensis]MCA0756073.1 GMC family oxidoreductase [Paenibacillus vietnamensis]
MDSVFPACPLPFPETPQDTWIPLVGLEQMERTRYDVLVVGTGAGGGAALWRLCNQWRGTGRKVGIIDAGGLMTPGHAWNVPTLNRGRWFDYIYNPRILRPLGLTLPEFPGARQLFALGGRTLTWGTVSPRMPASDMRQWPIPLREMQFYYKLAEQAMHVTQAYAAGSSITQILLERLWNTGFDDAVEIPMAVDLTATRYGEVRSDAFFSSISFFAEALNLMSFDFAVKARAVQVHVENGQALGLTVMSKDLKPYALEAKNIILSGSTFETPRLLLNSGIQGPAIGRYLTNHSSLTGVLTLNVEGFPEVLGTLGILYPASEGRPFQLQIQGPGSFAWYPQYEQKPVREDWEVRILSYGRVESRFENRVMLDKNRRDLYGVPEIQVQFSYSDKDREVIDRMADFIRQAAAAITGKSSSFMLPLCLSLPGNDNHESGTCRMGEDPLTSAVDPFGQLHGVRGLYVADNSVLPSSGAANPTLTTVALAIRTADYLSERIDG